MSKKQSKKNQSKKNQQSSSMKLEALEPNINQFKWLCSLLCVVITIVLVSCSEGDAGTNSPSGTSSSSEISIDADILGSWYEDGNEDNVIRFDYDGITIADLLSAVEANSGQVLDSDAKVLAEYVIENDTLYLEILGSEELDGSVDKAKAIVYVKVAGSEPTPPVSSSSVDKSSSSNVENSSSSNQGSQPSGKYGPSGVPFTNPIPASKLAELTTRMKFIAAKDSSFMMGIKDSLSFLDEISRPVHEVSFSYDFYMDSTEVTASSFVEVMKYAESKNYIDIVWPDSVNNTIGDRKLLLDIGDASVNIDWNGTNGFYAKFQDNKPADFMTRYGMFFFCNMLSEMNGLEPVYNLDDWSSDMSKNGYRLPTEAEWEYAARAGSDAAYPWGEQTSWIKYYATSTCQAVASKRSNDFGLYDMIGNALEDMHDYSYDYTKDAQLDPVQLIPDPSHQWIRGVVKSFSSTLNNEDFRSGERSFSDMGARAECRGLRIVLPVK